MGRAVPSRLQQNILADNDAFMAAYQRWQLLYDHEPSREPGETLDQFEARADRIGEEFRSAERTILLTQPASHIEIIAMLHVISGAEEIGTDQRDALCSIQSALAPEALREAGEGFYAQ